MEFQNILLPQKETSYPLSSLSTVPPPLSLATMNLFSVFMCLLFYIFHINKITPSVTFSAWAFSWYSASTAHLSHGACQYFTPFYRWIIFHCADTTSSLSIFSRQSIGLFPPLGNGQQCCCDIPYKFLFEYLFSVLLGLYRRMLLERTRTSCSAEAQFLIFLSEFVWSTSDVMENIKGEPRVGFPITTVLSESHSKPVSPAGLPQRSQAL